MLREAQAAGDESATTGIPIDEVSAMRAERREQARANAREGLEGYNEAVERTIERGAPEDGVARDLAMTRFQAAGRGLSRRDFLKGASMTAAAAALAGSTVLRPSTASAVSQPKIVIVGGGAAGLRCANRLWTRSGWTSTIYEWDDHLGGRLETLRNYFSNGQIAEMHGEYISSEHSATLNLASSYNLKLDDTNVVPVGVDTYWFNGSRYTQAQLDSDWSKTYWAVFNNAVKSVPWPQTYNKHSSKGVTWDKMTVPQWISANLPGGSGTQFARLCLEDVISEYGGDPSDQSALNLTFLLGYDDSAGGKGYQPQSSPVLAGTDERWHITGGNDQLITNMYNQVASHIGVNYGYQLVSIVKQSSGQFTCTFQVGTSTQTVTNIDRLVLALPFSTLRKVDLSKAGFTTLKMNAINNLGYGTNSKIIVQTNGRPWNTDGYTGSMQTDSGIDGAWELNYQTKNYSSPTALLLAFPGGVNGAGLGAKYGLTVDEGPAPAQMVTDYLAKLEQVLPGITAAYNGKAWYNVGPVDPHILGAWSYWRVGQYTTFSRYEGVAEGNAHFCGEHADFNFQGFIEGAIASGERVAAEV